MIVQEHLSSRGTTREGQHHVRSAPSYSPRTSYYAVDVDLRDEAHLAAAGPGNLVRQVCSYSRSQPLAQAIVTLRDAERSEADRRGRNLI
jgi:hypothetical protein